MAKNHDSHLSLIHNPRITRIYVEDAPMETHIRAARPRLTQPTRLSTNGPFSKRWSLLSIYFELKRRGVLQAGTSYIVVAWVIAQVAELIAEIFLIPAWVLQALLIGLAIGLPAALLVSWAFEVTPGGLKREINAPNIDSISQQKRRGLICVLTAILVVTMSLLFVNRDASVCSLTADTNMQATSATASP